VYSRSTGTISLDLECPPEGPCDNGLVPDGITVRSESSRSGALWEVLRSLAGESPTGTLSPSSPSLASWP
jgi:hypothetical protein